MTSKNNNTEKLISNEQYQYIKNICCKGFLASIGVLFSFTLMSFAIFITPLIKYKKRVK